MQVRLSWISQNFATMPLIPFTKKAKHKAGVFASALGLSQADFEWLRGELLVAATKSECTRERETEHGQRYTIDFEATFRIQTARL